jgi:DnaK suppressor protein
MNLSESELKRFNSLLLKLRSEHLEAVKPGQEAEQVVELDQARVGRLSRMDALQAQAISLETGRRRRQLIIEIDAAIERVKSGGYGDCLECGEIINPKRLEADPAATLCINCAQAQE